MSEPAVADMSAMDAAPETHSPQSPAASDQTVVASPTDNAPHGDSLFEPGLGLALFSTELGTRPQRSAPLPPFAPPIARSDPVQAVVDTALFWRLKFYRASCAVFPLIGWNIEDLWDVEDIHIYDEDHCREVLKFLSQDNLNCARRFAQEWAQANREQVIKILVRDWSDVFDLANPWSLLHKLFVNGESNAWPPQFLWHAAYLMRIGIEVELAKQQLAAAPPAVQQPVSAATKTVCADPSTARAPQPSLATAQHMSAPFVPRPLPNNQLIAPQIIPGGRRPPSYGLPQPDPHYGQQIGHVMGGMPPNPMGSPSMSGEFVRNPKTRPYNHNMAPGMYRENIPHMTQGVYPPRLSSNTMHSPHLDPAVMAMGQAVMPHPHPMQPLGYPQGYQQSLPSLYPAQPHHPGLGRPGPHQQQAYMPNPMAAGYVPQGPNDRGARGSSFGDRTNMPYNVNNTPSHNADPRRPGRQNSSYSSGSHALYDPYNGTRPDFNDPNAGRKSSRGGFMDQPGRARKTSAPDSRPRTGSYGTNWADAPGNGNRTTKGSLSDDPAITNDSQRGCHARWIGPENHTVNELYVGHLPDNCQEDEIKDMFAREINIMPVRANIVEPARQHAFVLFTTASEAKLGLRAGDAGPSIRGVRVRITVPRRFFSKPDGHYNYYKVQKPDNKAAEEHDTQGLVQMSSHEAERVAADVKAQTSKLQYSPQDVRSDLQKTSLFSSDTDFVSPTSPEAQATVREEPVEKEPSSGAVKTTVESEPADVSMDELKAPTAVPEILKEQQLTAPPSPSETDIAEKLPVSRESVQPVSDDANAIIESSPAHSSAPEQTTTGHTRVESQTKAPFEVIEANRDEDEKVHEVVKTPGPAYDDAVQVNDNITLADGKDSKALEVETEPATAQEPGSDDEADQDDSFQSAQEVVDSTEPTSVVEVGSPTTSHGNELGTVPARTSPAREKTSLPLPVAAHTNSQSSPVEAAQTSSTPASMTVAIDSEDKHDTAMAKDTETTKTTTSKPAVATMKSQGPQQTPSLNPFAKPSKTQRKKDKQQQKKKKDPKTAKAKAGEASTAAGGNSSAPTANAQPDILATSVASSSSDQAQSPVPPTVSVAQAVQATESEDEAEVELATANDPDGKDSIASGKDKEASSDQQSEGATANSPGETGSVTPKTEADEKTATLEVQDSSALETTSHARSTEDDNSARKSDQSALTTTVTSASTPVSKGSSVKSNVASTAPKTKKTVPAVPNIKVKANLPLTRKSDAESAASSDTLHPSDSAAQPSPSPTAADFHTPLQTPACTSETQEQVVPPKKKKNKKKKKKTAATYDSNADPFGHQMSHIDAIRKATKDPTTYFNTVNREIAGRKPNKNQDSISTAAGNTTSPGKANQKSNENMDDPAVRARQWREIQGFFRENPDLG